MPLLAMLLGIQTATPLVALVMLTTVAAILWGTREHIDLSAAWQLVGASILGLPVGLMLVRFAPEDAVTAVLGAILVLYGLYNLARPTLPKIEHPAWVLPFGFAAGVIGGAYNANGPPVVIYGALRRWEPDRFRATLQGFFLPADILICASHGVGGLWSLHVFELFALTLPAIALGLVVGGRLGKRIPPEQFGRVLYVSVVVLGALLFF